MLICLESDVINSKQICGIEHAFWFNTHCVPTSAVLCRAIFILKIRWKLLYSTEDSA